jgi:glutaredoxin 3
VVVFSKSYCPYCKNTKKLFARMDIPAAVFELDQLGAQGRDLQAALLTKTGQRTGTTSIATCSIA